jgi:hypothetical protein
MIQFPVSTLDDSHLWQRLEGYRARDAEWRWRASVLLFALDNDVSFCKHNKRVIQSVFGVTETEIEGLFRHAFKPLLYHYVAVVIASVMASRFATASEASAAYLMLLQDYYNQTQTS